VGTQDHMFQNRNPLLPGDELCADESLDSAASVTTMARGAAGIVFMRHHPIRARPVRRTTVQGPSSSPFDPPSEVWFLMGQVADRGESLACGVIAVAGFVKACGQPILRHGWHGSMFPGAAGAGHDHRRVCQRKSTSQKVVIAAHCKPRLAPDNNWLHPAIKHKARLRVHPAWPPALSKGLRARRPKGKAHRSACLGSRSGLGFVCVQAQANTIAPVTTATA